MRSICNLNVIGRMAGGTWHKNEREALRGVRWFTQSRL